MTATDPAGVPRVVVDPDATRAGREVRARLDAGERVAGFVGDRTSDAAAIEAFVADVTRSTTS